MISFNTLNNLHVKNSGYLSLMFFHSRLWNTTSFCKPMAFHSHIKCVFIIIHQDKTGAGSVAHLLCFGCKGALSGNVGGTRRWRLQWTGCLAVEEHCWHVRRCETWERGWEREEGSGGGGRQGWGSQAGTWRHHGERTTRLAGAAWRWGALRTHWRDGHRGALWTSSRRTVN